MSEDDTFEDFSIDEESLAYIEALNKAPPVQAKRTTSAPVHHTKSVAPPIEKKNPPPSGLAGQPRPYSNEAAVAARRAAVLASLSGNGNNGSTSTSTSTSFNNNPTSHKSPPATSALAPRSTTIPSTTFYNKSSNSFQTKRTNAKAGPSTNAKPKSRQISPLPPPPPHQPIVHHKKSTTLPDDPIVVSSDDEYSFGGDDLDGLDLDVLESQAQATSGGGGGGGGGGVRGGKSTWIGGSVGTNWLGNGNGKSSNNVTGNGNQNQSKPNNNNAIAGPSRLTTTTNNNTSSIAQLAQEYQLPQYQALTSTIQTHLPFRATTGTANGLGVSKKKGKTWDRTAFAKTGRKVTNGSGNSAGKSNGKGKAKKKKKNTGGWFDGESDEDEDEEELELDFDQFPRPFVDPNAPPPEPRHLPNDFTSKTYIYPTNFPKRDYQFEIVQACILDNTLVALPTGLGKTFIAGVLLLNFYRWFPSGKLVFLMPTKPLVTQQHEACQASCGIPPKDSATITGDDPEGWRDKAWKEKRVIYATPQTFMMDMLNGRVDPLDICLVIVDEAHKASGNHSYVQCISYLKSFHPHFRIVALTATPGRTTEKVQGVVDNLHISRIEIREAEAPEIAKYMFKKEIIPHHIEMPDAIAEIRDSWAKLMRPKVAQLVKAGMLTERSFDCIKLKAFTVTALRINKGRPIPPNMYGTIATLATMATAMGQLLEFSLGMFHTQLLSLMGDTRGSAGKPGKQSKNANASNPEFKRILQKTEHIMTKSKSIAEQHPKLDTVKNLVIQHLTTAKLQEEENGVPQNTRCMVFCSFRAAVGEIVALLNEENPLIRAHKFVGRAGTKEEGDKGLTQVEQKQVIEKFKKGIFNVLVSTSIGEEGLDIGEVDFIIIYNCPNESIKMLQRIGRAGRKRNGQIHVMMTAGREDTNWDAAMANHQEMQTEIMHCRNIELFDDVKALLPKMPQCEFERMDTVPFVAEDKKATKRKRASTATKAVKRVRGVQVPEGASLGFVSAAQLTKGGKKGKGKAKEVLTSDSETDLMDTQDLLFGGGDGSGSDDPMDGSGGSSARQKSLKRKENEPKPKPKKKSKKQTPIKSSQEKLDQLAAEFFRDEVDAPHARLGEYSEDEMDQQPTAMDQEPLFAEPSSSAEGRIVSYGSSHRSPAGNSRKATTSTGSAKRAKAEAADRLPADLAAQAGFSQVDMSMSWMLDDSDEEQLDSKITPVTSNNQNQFKLPSFTRTKSSIDMPPPPVPLNRSYPSPMAGISDPEPSPIPVRRLGLGRRVIASPADTASPASVPQRKKKFNRPLAEDPDDSPIPVRRRRTDAEKRAARAAASKFIETEVGVSDEEEEEAEDETDTSGEEDESDRKFAGYDFAPTQAPAEYDQQRAYMAGLATQAPKGGPAFADRSGLMTNFLSKARKPIMLSQESPRHADPSSEYDDSFVCGDDSVEYDSD